MLDFAITSQTRYYIHLLADFASPLLIVGVAPHRVNYEGLYLETPDKLKFS
jgi:hypothetical protein